ncbi:MAG: sulfotransferase [Planctomycetales bacterium]|nr:sulfotransferase [Planctomycetales bacterium]
MWNQSPIFVNGFSRGGTTILTNLLASHPNVCLVGETHHLFKGHSITDSPWNVLRKCIYNDAPILARQWQDFFSPRLVEPRKRLGRWARKRVDHVFYREKLRSRHPILNRFKSPVEEYAKEELAAARLLAKNIDGMIYATDEFARMYPDATFFGLLRNGLAVCEGHLRRGRSAEEIGWRYQVLVDKMCADADRIPHYKLLRFEDLLSQPAETLFSVFAHAGLDPERVSQVRMQARRVMDSAGNHRLQGSSEWDVTWLPVSELSTYLQRDVDSNQVRQLSEANRDAFLKHAGRAMERLGYSTEFAPVAGRHDADSTGDVDSPSIISIEEVRQQRRQATSSNQLESQRKAA